METKIGIGIYGGNGHQVHSLLEGHPHAFLAATAAFDREKLPASLRDDPSVVHHPSLDALLADPRVALVSLCSPRRRDQAAEAMKALRAGKHVYAEKPCAMTEAELDALLAASRETGRAFREMAGTAFCAPYDAMRRAVLAGRIGEVVQVAAEKSYPYHDARPQDEDDDGGLIAQCAVHALRFVEHVAGTPIASVAAVETSLGNPVAGGGLRMAASLTLGLANGGVASVAANYLNPRGTGVWGYEALRIWGTLGMIESTRGGEQTRLVVGGEDHGPLPPTESLPDYLDLYLDFLRTGKPMPLTPEEELSPTRWALRAREKARAAAAAAK
ncbi:MAG TPA: Gfo/Idh/MocA family oxidoreductase [Candidatus Methylacidiphilales bacterium]